MRTKKFLGIPVIIIAVVLIVALLSGIGGYAGAAFLFNRSQPATVTIKGSGAALFQDAACTIALGDTVPLAFGDVRVGTPSNTVTMYLKNTGSDPLFPKASTNIATVLANLSLLEATYGAINGTLKNLYTASSQTFTPGTVTMTVDTMTASQTGAGKVSGSVPATALPWYFKVGNEVIKVNAFDGTASFTSIERGYLGTTPAAHAAGSSATFGTITTIPETPLASGAVLPIALHVEATGDVTASLGQTKNFQVILDVTSNY